MIVIRNCQTIEEWPACHIRHNRKEWPMKIGNLIFKDWAAKKPLSVSPSGEFVTAKEILSSPALGLGSLHALPEGIKLKLVLERYKFEPDFKLAILGVGILSKHEILTHIQKQTEFGRTAVNVEIDYCNELIAILGNGKLVSWPTIPKGKIPNGPDWKPVKKNIWIRLKTQALFCENTTDSVTKGFADYRIANVHPVFAARGFSVVVLKDHDDIRSKFVPSAKSNMTGYVGGIGHGAYSLYTGDSFNHILEVGMYDPAEVRAKAFHFLSCETAGKLGPDTVTNGAKCYLGYDENFTFVWDDSTTPVNEVLLFEQADSIIDIMMANGATAQKAYDAAVQAFDAGMAQVPGSAAAAWLKYDRDHLKLLGDRTTVILPYRYIQICFPLNFPDQVALADVGDLVEA
jgi:hypothetical protein